jgi:hypothetical protein
MRAWQRWAVGFGSLAVAMGAGVGAAVAAIPDSGGVIHACYKIPVPAHGSPLNVIDSEAGGSCASGSTAVTWNQAGPQGPQGPAGPAGPAGPSTAGSSGLDVVVVTANDPTGRAATAVCPSDHPYLTGGGGDATNGVLGFSEPFKANGSGTYNAWIVANNPAQGLSATNSFAICSK